MNPELLYQLALTLVPHIGDVHAKLLLQQLGTASAVFRAGQSILEKIEGIGSVRARAIRSFRDFRAAEKELRFIEKYGIRPLFLTDAHYPGRLLQCYDAPALLFYKGSANLNASKIVGIVGTRSSTEYGKRITEQLVTGLSAHGVVIVSGLAMGIDAAAHGFALRNNLPTVGVVGHGLDTIYPSLHADLARDMVRQGGGLLSEFFSGTGPDKHNFPLRNRIVAGLCDATVVVETDVKGGSMITAKLADAYNRDVFAVPGRTTDRRSSGCNYLIQHNKAVLLTDAAQLLQVMGWEDAAPGREKKKSQKTLFMELSPEEKKIAGLLQENDSVHIDVLNMNSGLSSSAVAAALLNLELEGVISSLPGKMYRLV